METLPSSFYANGTGSDNVMSAIPVEDYIEAISQAENDKFALKIPKEVKKVKKNGVNSNQNYPKSQKPKISKKSLPRPTNSASQKVTPKKSIKSSKPLKVEASRPKQVTPAKRKTKTPNLDYLYSSESDQSSCFSSSPSESDIDSSELPGVSKVQQQLQQQQQQQQLLTITKCVILNRIASKFM